MFGSIIELRNYSGLVEVFVDTVFTGKAREDGVIMNDTKYTVEQVSKHYAKLALPLATLIQLWFPHLQNAYASAMNRGGGSPMPTTKKKKTKKNTTKKKTTKKTPLL
jgi:hypothetical protein